MSARRSGAAAAGRPARVRRRGGKGRAAGGQDQGSGAARGRTQRPRHAAAHMTGSSIPASSCGFAGGGGRIRADPLRAQAPRRGGHSCGPPAPPLVALSLHLQRDSTGHRGSHTPPASHISPSRSCSLSQILSISPSEREAELESAPPPAGSASSTPADPASAPGSRSLAGGGGGWGFDFEPSAAAATVEFGRAFSTTR